MNARPCNVKLPSYKQPVDCASTIEKGPRRPCSQLFAAKWIEEHRLTQVSGNTSLCRIEIQVTRNEEWGFVAVTLRIEEGFSQLSAPQFVVAATFKVQVISDEGSAADMDMGDEGDSTAQALLKRFRARQVPARAPKMRLLAKTD
jgi:hypothetical protein